MRFASLLCVNFTPMQMRTSRVAQIVELIDMFKNARSLRKKSRMPCTHKLEQLRTCATTLHVCKKIKAHNVQRRLRALVDETYKRAITYASVDRLLPGGRLLRLLILLPSDDIIVRRDTGFDARETWCVKWLPSADLR